MIEELALSRAIEIADMDQVRLAFSGLPLDQRLRALAECTILLDGPQIAIFKAKWLGDFEAVILDIDDNHTVFQWEALDHLFGKLDARSVSLASQSREAGTRFRAIFVGYKFGSVCCTWDLRREEYVKAERPVRTEERVEVPRPLNGQERKAARKLLQAEAR
jgi:hypothetical protein